MVHSMPEMKTGDRSERYRSLRTHAIVTNKKEKEKEKVKENVKEKKKETLHEAALF